MQNKVEFIQPKELPVFNDMGIERNLEKITATNGDILGAWNSIGIRAKTFMYGSLYELEKGNLSVLHQLEEYIDLNNINNQVNLDIVKDIVKIKALMKIKSTNLLKGGIR